MDACEKLLSIIIPSYNMEEYLPKCIGSLMVKDKSLFNALDVIVVNDGSQDRTSDIAHEWAGKYPEVIRVIDKPNGHYGSCINAGLKIAEGKYVKVLDADDWFDAAEFADYVRVLGSLPAGVDLVLNDYLLWYSKSGTTSTVNLGVKTGEWSFTDIVKANIQIVMPCITYRTQVLRDANYHQTEKMLYTDIDWNTVPMRNVQSVYVMNKMVYCYRMGRAGQSISVQGRNLKMMEALVLRSRDWLLQSSKCSDAYKEYAKRTFLKVSTDMVMVLMFDGPYSAVNAGFSCVNSAAKSVSVDADRAFDKLSLLSRSVCPYRYFRVWQKNGSMSYFTIWAIRRASALIRILHRHLQIYP